MSEPSSSRSDPTAREAAASRSFDGRLPPPELATIETTRFCNLRCKMCVQYLDGTTTKGPHMGEAIFERIAASVLPYVERWHPSIAGEPLIARDFMSMLQYARAHGVGLEIITNGTQLDEAMLDALLPNLASLAISFDAPDRETFEQIRCGASYDEVRTNVERVVHRCRAELPPHRQPVLGLNCTLMLCNARGLPGLVDLAAELEVHYLRVQHVHPTTEDVRRESLAHDPRLARECIEAAVRRAEAIGMSLIVEPLGQLTAKTAGVPHSRRELADRDGHLPGLGRRTVNPEAIPRMPTAFGPVHDAADRRRTASAAAGFPPAHRPDTSAPAREPVWYCDFLWRRVMIHVDADVKTCCVPGAPTVGNLWDTPLEQVWNSDSNRVLRQRLVRRDPAPLCKGCMHIRELSDPVAIDRALQGMNVPSAGAIGALPPSVDPTHPRSLDSVIRGRADAPPTLRWSGRADVADYVVEFSIDHFLSVEYSTDWHGERVTADSYRPAAELWAQAPANRTVFWRATARGEPAVAGEGSIAPVGS
jgi:MoaA/NifB/PqqE/SkfB family radical SAM enzyme